MKLAQRKSCPFRDAPWMAAFTSVEIAMLRKHLQLISSVAIVAVVACEGRQADSQAPGITVRDSAGIEIIENLAPVWDSTEFWTVGREPEFVIGGALRSGAPDSSHLVWNIRSATPLSDGRVAMLAPGADKKVLVFERSGRLSTSFGRSGRGPGEFFRPQHLRVLPGDTIAVWDYMFGPVNYFDPAGTLLKERSIDLGAVVDATRTDEWVPGETVRRPLSDGSFIVEVRRATWRLPQEWELYREPVGFVRIDSTYSAHWFGWWDGPEFIHGDVPFVPSPLRSMVTAGGDPLSVYLSNGDRYEIHQFSATGELLRIIRRTVDVVPMTTKELDEWKRAMKEGNPMMDWARWERTMAQAPRRFHRPISAMRVDPQGYLWIFDRTRTGGERPTSEWSVFDAEGRWLGTVAMPTEGVYWIGEDLVLGQFLDSEFGVETVEGYRLNRRGRL